MLFEVKKFSTYLGSLETLAPSRQQLVKPAERHLPRAHEATLQIRVLRVGEGETRSLGVTKVERKNKFQDDTTKFDIVRKYVRVSPTCTAHNSKRGVPWFIKKRKKKNENT